MRWAVSHSKWLIAALAVVIVPWSALAGEKEENEAKELKDKLRNEAMVAKGLEWLKRRQYLDGHWADGGGQYPTTMTSLAGMAMLMEGSNLREGKYSDNILKAVEWLLSRAQENGLIGNPNNPTESSRYMYGQGYAMMFLASAMGDAEDSRQQKKIAAVLTKAVKFTEKAQTTHGGWGYVAANDGGDFDEGHTAVMQIQGLRACQNAGIVVLKAVIERAMKYFESLTTTRGGLIYNYNPGALAAVGAERPPVTATALASAGSLRRLSGEYPKQWAKFCKENIYTMGRYGGHDEFQSYYLAQGIYMLNGDNGYDKMKPEVPEKERMKWAPYKQGISDHLQKTQSADGNWNGGYSGAVFATATALTVLQLDNAVLPIYYR